MKQSNFILSGRYELLRPLGGGANGTVYLARHNSLESEFAVKIYPKTSVNTLQAEKEARLLLRLHHPGIPFVQDMDEDDERIYLVQEYVPGESLEEFLLHQHLISHFMFYRFCSQICGIFAYLHTCVPEPVLYQDLKPEHVIVCGTGLKLIDFGDAGTVTTLGNSTGRFGNEDFSAPEFLAGGEVSAASDVYSLGKLFAYLAEYVDHPLSQSISEIFQKATSADPKERYPNAEALGSALETQHQKEKVFPHLLQTVAVVGCAPGCGATHIAAALCTTLNSLGFSAFYYEKDHSNALRQMQPLVKHMTQTPEGYYVYRNFKGFPEYGPGIRIRRPEGSVAILDYGSSPSAEIGQADRILLVCDDALWRRHDALSQAESLIPYSDRLTLLCNPGSRDCALFLAKRFSKPVYRYFYDSIPFIVNEQKIAFAQKIFQIKGGRWYCFARSMRNIFSPKTNTLPPAPSESLSAEPDITSE